MAQNYIGYRGHGFWVSGPTPADLLAAIVFTASLPGNDVPHLAIALVRWKQQAAQEPLCGILPELDDVIAGEEAQSEAVQLFEKTAALLEERIANKGSQALRKFVVFRDGIEVAPHIDDLQWMLWCANATLQLLRGEIEFDLDMKQGSLDVGGSIFSLPRRKSR